MIQKPDFYYILKPDIEARFLLMIEFFYFYGKIRIFVVFDFPQFLPNECCASRHNLCLERI